MLGHDIELKTPRNKLVQVEIDYDHLPIHYQVSFVWHHQACECITLKN